MKCCVHTILPFWIAFGFLGLIELSPTSLASRSVFHDGSYYSLDSWGSAEGLPQSSVIAMTQTRDGYLWLGTLNGLVRFDGIRFTVFDEGNTPGLNSSRIVSLFEDSKRNLWIGTETAGVALRSAKDGTFLSFDLGRGRREGRLISVAEDNSGTVWLYTADGQLCRYRDGRADVWNSPPDSLFSHTRALTANANGRVWLGTDSTISSIRSSPDANSREWPAEEIQRMGKLDGLLAAGGDSYWRLGEGQVQKWDQNQMVENFGPYPWRTQGVRVSAVCADQQARLVVGTLGSGLFWYNSFGRPTHLNRKEGLSHDYILSFLSDREGNLWIGTDGGGLNRLKRQVFESISDSVGQVAQSVCEDNTGGLWIGANSGGVSFHKSGVTQRFLTNLPVRSVFVDLEQHVWVGTWGAGLFQFQNGNFRRVTGPPALHGAVSAIHQDRHGRLWVGTYHGLAVKEGNEWKVLTEADGLSANDVRAVADDAEGNVWVGTVGGGLNRWHNERFETFRKQDRGLPSDDISSLHLDDLGVLWIGTGSGLARLHQGRWTRYTTREGLISNGVSYIVEDELGSLWIGSTAGLMRVSKEILNRLAAGSVQIVPCRAYDKGDGLPSRECTQGSQPGAFRGRSGRLWFPTAEGVVSVNPTSLKPNPFPPPVVIESVSIDGEPLETDTLRSALSQSLNLPPGRQRLEIQFTSLNLAAPERARFKYQLQGHETGWTELGDTRVARYSSLGPGEYRFEVTACNEDGKWNEQGASLTINVAPPFWRTWQFLTASTMLLLGMTGGVVHFFSTQHLQRQVEKLRQQEALERERARIARDLHDQLGANLTQVALLGELVESDKDSPDEVESLGQQIARTARDTTVALDEIVWAANPSNDTLEGLINYLCKYGQDYFAVAGIRYRVELPAQLPPIPIPPEVRHNFFLAAKEAITNVVRHAKCNVASLRLDLEPTQFTVEIIDDGCGLAAHQKKIDRNGLLNMRKRMEDIGGRFSIAPAPSGGTMVRLTAPITAK